MTLQFALLRRILISGCDSSYVKFLKPVSFRHSFQPLLSRCRCKHFLQNQSNSLNLLQARLEQISISVIQSREKSSKNRSKEYESESDSDDEIAQVPGSKVVQVQSDSLRCDAVLKLGLGLSRNKLEVLFYEGRIRINGMKTPKKSVAVHIGDEVDIIKGINEDNPNFLTISRVEVLKARPTGDIIILTLKKSKTLLIENYEKHPWVEPSPEKGDESS